MRHRNERLIYQARRAGLVARLGDTVGLERAEALVAAWEDEATRREMSGADAAFWQQGDQWTHEESRRRAQ